MILITVTHTKEKLILLLKLLLLIMLLGLFVPKLFVILSDAGSLHRWAEKEQLPPEPMRVEQAAPAEDDNSLWTLIVNSFK
ncbi:hypothetical protein [Candidatus Formimonas warabiya]|uniref:Uncharacterized protein n=1 Tax=Formimonas warabiya TaxID=1761012 RepID=A0A3G1KNM7_FORW1|nr:hypothetical protein [Candidatus Formimonas warabiya]ATW24074.1 hypothetical protein DCMF_04090 [Candidatus Formimonas warabiya]